MQISLSKRIAVSVLAVLMAIAFMPLITFSSVNAEETVPEYTGNEESLSGTYTISNASQLNTLSKKVNAGTTYEGVTFELKNDITLSGEFTPIGISHFIDAERDNKELKKKDHPFSGTFDGSGHMITGLTIAHDNEEKEYVGNLEEKDPGNVYEHDENSTLKAKGLFGFVKNGTIKNLTVSGANVTGWNAEAAVVGTLETGTIEKVKVVDSKISGEYENAGAVVGNTLGKVKVTGCEVSGCTIQIPVNGEATAKYQNGAGGLIGRTQGDDGSTITGNTVKNTTVSAYRKAAGLVGYILQPASIELTGNDVDADITVNAEVKNQAQKPYYGIITAEIQGKNDKDTRGFEKYDEKNIRIEWVDSAGKAVTNTQGSTVTTEKTEDNKTIANTGKIRAKVGDKTETVYAGTDSQIADLKKTVADLHSQLNAAQSQSTKANTDNDAKIKALNDQLTKAQSDLKAAQDSLKAAQEQQANTAAAYTVPGKVTNLKAKAGKKKITLTWKKASNATGYKIYRASKKSGKYKYYKAVKGQKYVNKSLKKDKKYYYKVRAYKTIKDGQLFGAYSNIAGAKAK